MNDFSKRPERLGWVAAAIGLFLLACGALLSVRANCTAMIPACIASGVIALISLMSGLRARFARRQAEEETDFEQFRKEHTKAELFDDSDEAVKLAARTNLQFVTFGIPAFTLALGAAILLSGTLFWLEWNSTVLFPQAQAPLRGAVLALGLFLAGIIPGSYFIGSSREPGCRWLRPCGAWIILAAFLYLASGSVLVCEHLGVAIHRLDVRMARITAVIILALGVELIINFIIEFYRPRTVGEEERPLYESRLLALFTEPGGIARNVATSLDYQFGFKVSEFWFYRFLERTVIPFGMLMIGLLWLQTCFVVVGTEEQGIREWFGKVASQEPLEPGLYVKLPSPFGHIYKFPVERVQEIPIGYVPGGAYGEDGEPPPEDMDPEMQGDPTGRVIVWSKIHNKEELDFVVASDPEMMDDEPEGPDSSDTLPVTVSFMSASIPLYFRVKDLYSYAYRHREPLKTLEQVATREVVSYLANIDFFTILTHGRAAGGEELRRRIQTAADEHQLGIEVVFVGLQGIHPPVRVGAAFDDVVAAMEEKHEQVLIGEKYEIAKIPDAEGTALQRRTQAEAYRQTRVQVSSAESERFTQQLLAFSASPKLFVLRTFLDVLENEGSHARKYVVAFEKGTEIFILDLQEKLRSDLLDLDLDAQE